MRDQSLRTRCLGTYARKLGSFRLAGFLGATIPVGAGGGDTPDKGAAAANKAGIAARSGMDNAMFAVDYLTAIGGVDAAYVDHRVTIQAEATLFQLFRVRGAGTAPARGASASNNAPVTPPIAANLRTTARS